MLSYSPLCLCFQRSPLQNFIGFIIAVNISMISKLSCNLCSFEGIGIKICFNLPQVLRTENVADLLLPHLIG